MKKIITQSDINYFFMVLANAIELAEDNTEKESRIVSDNYNAIRQTITEEYETSLENYSAEELKIIGFRRLNKDSNLYLVPVWFYSLIPDGTELIHSESGEVYVKGVGPLPDSTHQFGLMVYGVETEDFS
jgi:hypothetical protein